MRFDRLAPGGWSSVALGLVLGQSVVGAHAAAFDAKAGQAIDYYTTLAKAVAETTDPAVSGR